MADRYLGRHPGLHRNGYKLEAGRRDRNLSHHISYSNSLFVDLDSCDSWCPLAVLLCPKRSLLLLFAVKFGLFSPACIPIAGMVLMYLSPMVWMRESFDESTWQQSLGRLEKTR